MSTGKQSTKESTEKVEFFKPVYEPPIVIEVNPNEVYAKAGIPKRYYDMSFEWLRKHGTFPKENSEAYAVVNSYADALEANISSGKGLILRGPAGTGKTSIAISILKRAIDLGYRSMMISMPGLLDTMLTLSKGPTDSYIEFEQKIRNMPVLLLDDFGAEYKKSEWVAAKVDDVIIDRYNRMKPIILTTNYSGDWTKSHYSQRIYDRLRGEYEEAIFNGASHR